MASNIFTTLSDYKVIVCIDCKHAIWPHEVSSHLRGTSHALKPKAAATFQDEVQGWHNIADNASQIRLPSTIQSVIGELHVYNDGWACALDHNQCRYICRSQQGMRNHFSVKHRGVLGGAGGKRAKPGTAVEAEAGKLWERVTCQQFFKRKEGSHFIQVQAPVGQQERSEARAADGIDQRWQELESNIAAIRQAGNSVREADTDDTRAWLSRTEWPSYLHGLPRDRLLEMAQEPDAKKEPVAYKIWTTMGELASICQETVGRVGFFERMEVVRVELSQTKYRPLQPYMHDRAIREYGRVWKQILVIIFRLHQTQEWPAIRWRFDKKEKRAFERLRKVVETEVYDYGEYSSQEDEDYSPIGDDSRPTSRESERRAATSIGKVVGLHRSLLNFCIAMLARRTKRGQYDSVLVCCTAVLGVSEEGWHGPATYPPILSKIIKIARFMVVQEAWQAAGFGDESSGDGEEDEEGVSCRELIKNMTDRFMIKGSGGAMEWLLDLRTYMRTIFTSTTGMGHIDWVGTDTIRFKSIEFTMDELRATVDDLVGQAQEVLWGSVMSADSRADIPKILWSSLRDDPSRATANWNFTMYDANHWPVDGQRWLFDRLTTQDGRYRILKRDIQGGSRWDRHEIRGWLRSVVGFRELLLVLVHLTGGQPARAPEILSIKHSNADDGGLRNLFIENECVVAVTEYHKGYAISGSRKIIHRYLPRRVGELMVWYLWLVVPLQQRLQANIGDAQVVSNHLWPPNEEEKAWSGIRMSKVMRTFLSRLSAEGITIMPWRHLAIGISRMHIQDRKLAFQYDDEDDEGEEEDDIEDLQAGHGTAIAGSIYARGIQDMFGEIARKRAQFREASERWHRFLKLDTVTRELLGKRARADTREVGPIERWKGVRKVDLRGKLCEMMGEGSRFRGLQEAALGSILDAQPRVLVVMGTGGGKSLLFMLPAWLAGEGISIVVVPLIALRQDITRRCQGWGIGCETYEARKTSYDGPLILITPESVISDGFWRLVNNLKASGRLDRIVVDECHVVLNERRDYRPKLQRLGEVNRAGVQVVMLTATLPPSREVEFFRRVWVTREQVRIFRQSTSRGNIRYSRFRQRERGLEERQEELVEFLREQERSVREEGGVMIVYSNTVEVARQIAEELGCKAYHSKAEGKGDILDDLISGKEAVVVATSAFGMGIDIPNIRVAVHLHRPKSLLEYSQESGRVGRDGKRGVAWLVEYGTERAETERDQGRVETLVEREEAQWVDRLIGEGCIRVVLDEYLDGRKDREWCQQGEEACASCGDRVQVSEQQEEEIITGWQERRQVHLSIRDARRVAQSEASRLMGRLRERLERFAGRCMFCRRRGLREGHLLFRCHDEESEGVRKTYKRLRDGIRKGRKLERFGGCIWCLAHYDGSNNPT